MFNYKIYKCIKERRNFLTFSQMRANMIIEKSATDRRLVRFTI